MSEEVHHAVQSELAQETARTTQQVFLLARELRL